MNGPRSETYRSAPAHRREPPVNSPALASPNGPVSLEGMHGTVDHGLTCKLIANVQLDSDINTGVTIAAPVLNPFVGLS